MRVEGQGMALDFANKPSDIPGPVTDQGGVQHHPTEDGKRKIGLDQLHGSTKVNLEDVELATDILTKAMQISNYHLEFKLHDKSGRYQVKVIDSDSQQVIREIPPESALDYAARIREVLDRMVGILVDEKV